MVTRLLKRRADFDKNGGDLAQIGTDLAPISAQCYQSCTPHWRSCNFRQSTNTATAFSGQNEPELDPSGRNGVQNEANLEPSGTPSGRISSAFSAARHNFNPSNIPISGAFDFEEIGINDTATSLSSRTSWDRKHTHAQQQRVNQHRRPG